MPAAAAQVYAGIAASGLATFGDYGTAAFGFGLGAVVGVVVIAVFADHGVVAWGWGLAANGAIALGVPLARARGPQRASAARRGASGRGCATWPRARRCRSRCRAST